ncbi:MAG: protease HtpX [Deltaproteobacteria bacterium]|nr:protease HtpX [Deltaproteobacteria bacterium]
MNAKIYAKRIFLFLATNLAVLVLLGLVLNLLGIQGYLTATGGLDWKSLVAFAAVFGFGGSLISLAISKKMAKWATGARVIDEPRSNAEMWLVETVRRQANAAGIGTPEVAVFPSPEPNAFATGMSRNSALVAVSEGLLETMDKREVEAVLAHEVSHVANGDMVTLALVQGVVNTFVIVLARAVGWVIDRVVLRNEDDHGPGVGYMMTVMVLDLVFGIFASMIVASYSRRREFRADAGAASLTGKAPMISALRRLAAFHEAPSELPKSVQAFGIRGGQTRGFLRFFMTHPPIEERIAALEQLPR